MFGVGLLLVALQWRLAILIGASPAIYAGAIALIASAIGALSAMMELAAPRNGDDVMRPPIHQAAATASAWRGDRRSGHARYMLTGWGAAGCCQVVVTSTPRVCPACRADCAHRADRRAAGASAAAKTLKRTFAALLALWPPTCCGGILTGRLHACLGEPRGQLT